MKPITRLKILFLRHSLLICHICYCTLVKGKQKIEPVKWEKHCENNCITCIRFEQSKKAGRPKKSKRGGGPRIKQNEMSGTEQITKAIRTSLVNKVHGIMKTLPRTRCPQFERNILFLQKAKTQFYCPICTDLLEMLVETFFVHIAVVAVVS